MKELTILTKSNCFKCVFVEKWLKKRDISYKIESLEDFSDDYITSLKDSGLMSAPILLYGDEKSAGADMTFLEKIEKELSSKTHSKLTVKNP